MAKVTFDKIWGEVRSLPRAEQERLRKALDRWLSKQEAVSPEDELERRLFEAGLLSEVKSPASRPSAARKWKPIDVKGKPLSETIIEERR